MFSFFTPDGRLDQPADGAILWTARVGTSDVAIGRDDEQRKGIVSTLLNFGFCILHLHIVFISSVYYNYFQIVIKNICYIVSFY